MSIANSSAWQALSRHQSTLQDVHLRDLFAADPERFRRFSLTWDDLLFDYSKNKMTDDTLSLLLQLAEAAGLPAAIEAMFTGEKINTTENRPVLHVALRNRSNAPIVVDGEDVMPAVNAVLSKMRAFTEQIRSGQWRGYTDKALTDVVNIGIGGSHLGPLMATRALQPYADGRLRVHFVSNVDPTDMQQTLQQLNPETTLFLVASKSFTTEETMLNAQRARSWLVEHAQDDAAVARHFVAISTNAEAVQRFGIDGDNMFEFWDWVGGRYSLWSAIGLSIALYVGMDHFEALLGGAHAADEHFRTSPLHDNIPVIMGLLSVWYVNFWNASTHAVLPYDERLLHFNDYLRQLDTESNGKRVTLSGQAVDYDTGPIVWGAPGTDGQHAFYQLLHQGTRIVPADFLAAVQSSTDDGKQHDVLLAHCFAQTKALMEGRTAEEARKEPMPRGLPEREREALIAAKTLPGNQPTNTFLYRRLTPRMLGKLCALYEHKTFVQGVVWGINSFDQMGVELGKQLAATILPALTSGEGLADDDSSTKGLLAAYERWRPS